MELHLSSRSQCKTHPESPARHPGVQLSTSTAPAVVPNTDSPVSPVPAAHGDPLLTRSRSTQQPQRVPPCTRRAGTEKSPLPRSERRGGSEPFLLALLLAFARAPRCIQQIGSVPFLPWPCRGRAASSSSSSNHPSLILGISHPAPGHPAARCLPPQPLHHGFC